MSCFLFSLRILLPPLRPGLYCVINTALSNHWLLTSMLTMPTMSPSPPLTMKNLSIDLISKGSLPFPVSHFPSIEDTNHLAFFDVILGIEYVHVALFMSCCDDVGSLKHRIDVGAWQICHLHHHAWIIKDSQWTSCWESSCTGYVV